MKKRLIALIILTLSLGVVGCTSDKDETTSNSNEVVTQEESNEQKKRSSDEMYDLYTSKLEEVEKLFKENNINFQEVSIKKNKKYDGKVSIRFEDNDVENIGEFPVAGYGLSFEDNGEILYISAKMVLNVNDDDMKSKEFKFEDTEFYKLHNILIPEIKNADEINQKVNEAYKALTSLGQVDIENGNIKESIILGDNSMDYIILINP
mgnify:CR=1 FL=1